MSVDPSVIQAMISAVDADAENTGLRVHLISLLVDAGRFQEALDQSRKILAQRPDHLDALRFAEKSADGVGDTNAALGYRRLYTALGWKQTAGMLEGLEHDHPNQEEKPSPHRSAVIPPDDRVKPLRETAGGVATPPGGDDYNGFDVEPSSITLADVAGMEQVKHRLNLAFLGPLKNPDLMKMYGKSLRGGLLLYGPPGCGKTYVARATAGELGAKFISVGISDVLDMWLGESERNLHEIFEQARRSKPCVLFLMKSMPSVASAALCANPP